MNEYISNYSEDNVDELLTKLKACIYAVPDNDCIYFCTADGETYEVTDSVVKSLFVRLLGVKEEEM